MKIYESLFPYFKQRSKNLKRMRQCSWCGWVCWNRHWAEHARRCAESEPVDLDTRPEMGYYWFQLHPNKERLKPEPG